MKRIILILLFLILQNLFSNSALSNKRNFEIGVSLGIFTGNGPSLRYRFTEDFSFKVSGMIARSNEEEKLLYEGKFSLLYSAYDNKYIELYLITSSFKTNFIFEGIGVSLGGGLKVEISSILPFYNRSQGDSAISLLLEVQVNRIFSDEDLVYQPNILFGLLFDL
jgi:hypothetical protein